MTPDPQVALSWTERDIKLEIDRRLNEHAQLAVMVKRLAFLLNSARLVIGDKVARDIAGEAVREAEELLAKVRKP